jgi:cobalt-zinc-cadmium efflux system membrane fusion protein
VSARWSSLAALALLAATAGCGGGGEPAAAARTPGAAGSPATAADASVSVIHPQWRERTTALETSGKVQFNEETLVRIQAPLTGRVLEVLARPGDAVEPGRRLLVMESPDLGAAKSDYVKAASDAERAEQALRLARELFEVKAVPQKDVREAENDARKAVAERERLAARLRMLGTPADRLADVAARVDTSARLDVTAPRSGIVVERNATPGQVVAYGQSDTPLTLFVIADLARMWVLADVYEPDIPRVRRGQTVGVTLPCCPGDRFEGVVEYISDTVDRETRTIKVRAGVPNRGRALKAEMFVNVAIGTGSSRVLTVPQSAVHRENGQAFVLVETGPDAYARRAVRLGADFDGVVEVVDGVAAEDRVVGAGSLLLKKGAR